MFESSLPQYDHYQSLSDQELRFFCIICECEELVGSFSDEHPEIPRFEMEKFNYEELADSFSFLSDREIHYAIFFAAATTAEMVKADGQTRTLTHEDMRAALDMQRLGLIVDN